MPITNDRGETFGRWLLAQRDRGDKVGELAKHLGHDWQFRPDHDPAEVRRRLARVGAEYELFEAVEDAEGDWMSA